MKVVNLLLSAFLVLGMTVSVLGQQAQNNSSNTNSSDEYISSELAQDELVAANSEAYLIDSESSFTIISGDDIERENEIEFSNEYIKQLKGYKVGHSGVSVIVWPRMANEPNANPNQDYQIITVNAADSATALSAIKTEVHSAAQIELFPNPATEYVKVTFTESLTGKLYLLNLEGKLIKQIDLNEATNSYRFDLRDVESDDDVFLLTFSGASISWTKKLIIQRD